MAQVADAALSTNLTYMWRHRCAGGLKKKYLRLGSQRYRHFVGFFNVPVLHRHGATLFIRLFRETAPLRHGPFDILGGGAWDILEKKFLSLILTTKINLLNGTVKKIICLQ